VVSAKYINKRGIETKKEEGENGNGGEEQND
jgi:hypothetical protein